MTTPIRTASPGATLAAADPPAVRANKLELLERLADALAHEIKNPLHSMVINLEVLRRRLTRGSDEGDLLRYASVLDEELDRVSRRVELLLRLSRPDRTGAEETTLGELVEEVLELVHLEARGRDARVEYRTDGRMSRIRVKRQAARQAVLNLLLDALDGLSAGDTLHVRVEGHDGAATLTVQGAASDDDDEHLAVAAALADALGGRLERDAGALTLTLPAGG